LVGIDIVGWPCRQQVAPATPGQIAKTSSTIVGALSNEPKVPLEGYFCELTYEVKEDIASIGNSSSFQAKVSVHCTP